MRYRQDLIWINTSLLHLLSVQCAIRYTMVEGNYSAMRDIQNWLVECSQLEPTTIATTAHIRVILLSHHLSSHSEEASVTDKHHTSDTTHQTPVSRNMRMLKQAPNTTTYIPLSIRTLLWNRLQIHIPNPSPSKANKYAECASKQRMQFAFARSELRRLLCVTMHAGLCLHRVQRTSLWRSV